MRLPSGENVIPVSMLRTTACGVPPNTDYLVQAFAQRFSRGMGAAFITTLLAGVDSFMGASSTTLSADDLFGLVGSLNSAYAKRGSWLMSWKTLVAIFKTVITSASAGDALLR